MNNIFELELLIQECEENNVKYATFSEPDFNDDLTAICIESSLDAKKITSGLSLALKEYNKDTKADDQITYDQVLDKMSTCYQFKDVNMLQHGEMVFEYYSKLKILLQEHKSANFPLPKWFYNNADFILKSLPDDLISYTYMKFHDCGKPYVAEKDIKGNNHYPDHETVSADIFFKVFSQNSEIDKNIVRDVAILISRDMKIHKIKDKDVDSFCKYDNCILLLMSGLSEVLANSQMFGGFESTSFKIKFKQIEKRGCAILKLLNQRSEVV